MVLNITATAKKLLRNLSGIKFAFLYFGIGSIIILIIMMPVIIKNILGKIRNRKNNYGRNIIR